MVVGVRVMIRERVRVRVRVKVRIRVYDIVPEGVMWASPKTI